MSSITDLIREEIESLSTDPTKTNVGTITALADGVAKVEGLSKVMFNEMVEFPNDVLGIALNLEEGLGRVRYFRRHEFAQGRRRSQDHRKVAFRSSGNGNARQSRGRGWKTH